MRIALPAQTLYLLGVAVSMAFSTWLQFAGYLNPDCAWLMELAQRIINGERLYLDVSETNPPLAVWLHVLPAAFSHVTGWSLHSSFIIFVQLLSLFGCALAWRANRTYLWLNWAYVAIVFIMPVHLSGEREHLLLILALPYFLSLLPGNKPSALAAIPAAIGIALKPYFLLLPLVVIVYRAWQLRSVVALFDHTYWIMGAIISVYLGWLLLVDTTYVEHVLPHLLNYYHTYRTSDADLYKTLAIYFGVILFPYPLFLWVRSHGIPSAVVHMLFWLCVAALGTVWIQQKAWGNHLYVFLGISTMVNLAIFVTTLPNQQPFRNKLVAAFALLGLLVNLAVNWQVIASFVTRDWPEHTKEAEELITNSGARTAIALSFDLMSTYPAMFHTPVHHVGRYHHLWFLSGLNYDRVIAADRKAKDSEATSEKKTAIEEGSVPEQSASGDDEEFIAHDVNYRSIAEMNDTERHFFNEVVEDLVRKKPDLVIVTERSDYYHPQHHIFRFDFLRYYLQDKEFAREWKSYREIGKIEDQRYYLRREITPAEPASSSPQKAPKSP